MTSRREVAQKLCEALMFDGNGHGCGAFCQAEAQFGKAADAMMIVIAEAVAEEKNLTAEILAGAIRKKATKL